MTGSDDAQRRAVLIRGNMMNGSNGKEKDCYVYAFQPQYAGGSPASHRQFWRAAGSKYPNRMHVDGGGSLLANSFNQAWCHALNLQESGQRITHFAMLHDDVVPEEGWLDILIDDLVEHEADVMSAVIPIKDPLGITSCAIDDPADPFRVLRRITMTEVFNLPEVFGGKDCGYADDQLLVNTGCWVCDFTKDWRLKENAFGNLEVFFTIRDRIRRDTHERSGAAQWVAEVAPEDWHFSRQIHRLGGKIRATRRVRLSHYGAIPFSNQEPWGTCEQDTALHHRHGGKQVGQPGAYLSRRVEVRGWLTDQEGEKLAELAKDKTVLEVGSYCGRSTIWMARTAERVVAVDTFDGSVEGTEKRDTFEEFQTNLKKYGVWSNVLAYVGKSEDVLPTVEQRFDLAFIDGDHERQSVERDVSLCARLLKPGGLIALHDYASMKDLGVTAAVNDLLRGAWDVVEQAGSIIVIKPKKAALTSNGASNGEESVFDGILTST